MTGHPGAPPKSALPVTGHPNHVGVRMFVMAVVDHHDGGLCVCRGWGDGPNRRYGDKKGKDGFLHDCEFDSCQPIRLAGTSLCIQKGIGTL